MNCNKTFFVEQKEESPDILVVFQEETNSGCQSGIKCVIVATAMRAEQGSCEPIKGCIRKIREQL